MDSPHADMRSGKDRIESGNDALCDLHLALRGSYLLFGYEQCR
ncbi:hypothetical protein FHU13_005176 [Methylobacterium sp. R2-1]|nr:hypothetical protein [Methylobacterium sp. R2-1]